MRKGISVRQLNYYDPQEEAWKEIHAEDRTATPADLADSRIDFPAWLETLGSRNRKIALSLAAGETTKAVARRFQISPSRVSELRRELQDDWHWFHGEAGDTAEAAVAVA
jgi:hypothetical protein